MGCLIQAQDPEGLTRSVSDTSVVVNMLEGPVMESPIDRSSVYDQGMSKTGARFLYAKTGFRRDCKTGEARSGDAGAQARKADSETVDVVDSEHLLDRVCRNPERLQL